MDEFLRFVTGPLPGPTLPAAYDPALVVLSYVVASLAAYTAIDLAGRVSEFRAEPRRAAAWLGGGAFAMGAGIWSMHFVAMLAYSLPVTVRYEPWTTFASMVAAILTSGFALYIVTRGSLSWQRLLIGGTVMGAGIGTMHYTGMAAMRLDALVMYYIAPWLLSVANAIVCSTIALFLVFKLGSSSIGYRVLAAMVMGVAIAGMHYTGMYAAVCVSTGAAASGGGLDPAPLAAAIAVVTLLIMSVALTVSLQSQLLSRTLKEQNERLKLEVKQRRAAEEQLQQHRDNLQAVVDGRTRELSQANAGLRESEGRFRSLTELSSDWYWEQDAELRFIMTAGRDTARGGISPEEHVGMRRWELPGTSILHQTWDEHRAALEARQNFYDVKLRRVAADGKEHFISVSGAPIFDQQGAFTGYRGVASDVTDAVRAEEAIRLQAERLKIAQSAAKMIVLDWDILADRLEFSDDPSWLRGPPSADGARYPLFKDQVHPEDRAVFHEARKKAIETVQGGAPEFRIVRTDGEVVWVQSHQAVFAGPDGKAARLIAAMIDISERKRGELALREASDAAQAASRAKSAFLAAMSHEIRTPMNGVLGMTELLLGTQLDAKQRRFGETAYRSAVALLSVINDVLDFSKIEAGKFELQINPFNLRDLVEDVVDAMAEGARRKRLELSCLIPADVPLRVLGDDSRLRQILINLTGNAIKYTERGEVLLRVAVLEQAVDAAALRFEVKDTGIGIAADQLGRIFGAFVQAEGQSSRRFGGTGLGLSICKQLVEKMGGEIGVDSLPGAGSTFWFTLRLACQTDRAVAQADPMRGLRALIVDDNATNREVLGHQLTIAGLTHEQVDDASHALTMLGDAAALGQPFAIAVIDEQMPGQDGIALARAIRSEPALAAMPIVMLSSLGAGGPAAREAGVAYCLTRPVRQSQLFDCLASALGRDISAQAVASAQERVADLQAHVLLTEDHPVNQQLAVAMLESLGCQVALANDGQEALAALERTPFDLVLMDCQMPVMDGFDATREIRRREAALPNARRVPIIALTAGAVVGDREKCLAAGMDDYVTKPFSLEQLKQALRRWLPARVEAQTGVPRIDRQALERMRALRGTGGSELVARVVDAYLMDAPGRLAALRRALLQDDAPGMAQTAHAFKSGCANVGALGLAEICRRLEALGRTGSLTGAGAMLAEIEAEYPLAEAELAAHAQGAAA
jgi:PAS domain S-box-containing protein